MKILFVILSFSFTPIIAQVQQEVSGDLKAGTVDQQWVITAVDSDAEGIVVQIQSASTKKCVNNMDNSFQDGNVITQFDCQNEAPQQWVLIYKGLYFSLKNFLTRKCIGVSSSSLVSRTQVVQWTCLGIDDQKWTYTNGRLINKNSGKCLHMNGFETKNHMILEQRTCV